MAVLIRSSGVQILLLALTLLAGCREDEGIAAYRKFTAGPSAQVEAKFLALSPTEQVAVYVVAISRIKPSDTRFAPLLATEGDRVLPALVGELNLRRPGVPPQQLVLVLAMMARSHHLESALRLAPQVKGWCDAWYPPQSYCHEMGATMLDQTGDFHRASKNIHTAREFYRQPVAAQQKEFRQHRLQDQLDLFFFGNQIRHPPALYLAQCFALNGTAGVELLRSTLKEDTDDLTVRDIAMLLSTVDAMGTYDVAADSELMALLAQRIVKMHDEGWRETAERKMAGIGHRQNKNGSQAPECGQQDW